MVIRRSMPQRLVRVRGPTANPALCRVPEGLGKAALGRLCESDRIGLQPLGQPVGYEGTVLVRDVIADVIALVVQHQLGNVAGLVHDPLGL